MRAPLLAASLAAALLYACDGASPTSPVDADPVDSDAGSLDVDAGPFVPARDAGPPPGPDEDRDGDGYSIAAGDCDDLDPDVNPGAVERCGDGVDQDCRGGDPACTNDDADGDGVSSAAGDCDDLDPAIHPGANEIPYDGRDNDCDASTRDDDLDGDGHRRAPAGADCNDADPFAYPGATEVPYDGIDQDCRDGDLVDVDGDGYVARSVGGDDCDDRAATVHPGATEIPYDGIDQDCADGDLVDVDGDSYPGRAAGGDDCDDHAGAIHPGAPEVCGDGVDQDCMGGDLACSDVDGDGDGYTVAEGDCDDGRADVNPGATEIPYDGVDQDCDPSTRDDDLDGDGHRSTAGGGADCDDTDPFVYPGATETPYDGVDQDCRNGDLVDVDGDTFAGAEVGGPDCDDRAAAVHPGAFERPYDGVDQDCDGADTVDGATVLRAGGYGYGAAVVGGEEGFFVVYTDHAEGRRDLYVRAIDRSGAPSSPRLLHTSTGTMHAPALARISSGVYLLAFAEQRPEEGTLLLYRLTVDRAGTVTSGAITPFATLGGGAFTYPRASFAAAGDGDGRAILHYAAWSDTTALGSGIQTYASGAFTARAPNGACTGAGSILAAGDVPTLQLTPFADAWVASCHTGTGGSATVHTVSRTGVAGPAYALPGVPGGFSRVTTAWNGAALLSVASPWTSSMLGARIVRTPGLPPSGTALDLGPSGSAWWLAATGVAVGEMRLLAAQDLQFGPTVVTARWVDAAGNVGPLRLAHAAGPSAGATPVYLASSGTEAYVLTGDDRGLLGFVLRP